MIYLLEHVESLDAQPVLARIPELSAERRMRIAAYRAEQARLQSALAELLLRYAVRREFGLQELPEPCRTELGKPYFPELSDCRFSLSHCKTAVVCALDHSPVGVDVQEQYRYTPRLARVLSEQERLWVETKDSDARFTRLWTLKEAFGKRTGQGILYDMRSVTLIPQGEVWQTQGCVLQSYARQGFFLGVCAEHALTLSVVKPEEL